MKTQYTIVKVLSNHYDRERINMWLNECGYKDCLTWTEGVCKFFKVRGNHNTDIIGSPFWLVGKEVIEEGEDDGVLEDVSDEVKVSPGTREWNTLSSNEKKRLKDRRSALKEAEAMAEHAEHRVSGLIDD